MRKRDVSPSPSRLILPIAYFPIPLSRGSPSTQADETDKGAAFVIVDLPSEAVARGVQERCVMADKVLELWGHGERGSAAPTKGYHGGRGEKLLLVGLPLEII